MKKILITSATLFLIILLCSYTASKSNKINKTSVDKVFKQNIFSLAYGPWQKVSCYKGIQFRTVRGNRESDGSYWWSVQFRNLYSSEVRFSYNIVEPEKESEVRKEQLVLDSWRLSAGADPEKEGNDSPHAGNYVRSSEKVFVFITKVRLAINGNLDVPPIKCDY